MTGILNHIENQTDFPLSDLTEGNAEFLALVLANSELLSRWHLSSERAHPIFKGLHEPLVIAARNLFPDWEQVRNFNFGIRAFEAVTLLVGAEVARADLTVMEGNINTLVSPVHVDGVREYFEEAEDAFRTRMPRTAEVIEETSQRFVPSPRLAVLGGAAARSFEIHNAEGMDDE